MKDVIQFLKDKAQCVREAALGHGRDLAQAEKSADEHRKVKEDLEQWATELDHAIAVLEGRQTEDEENAQETDYFFLGEHAPKVIAEAVVHEKDISFQIIGGGA